MCLNRSSARSPVDGVLLLSHFSLLVFGVSVSRFRLLADMFDEFPVVDVMSIVVTHLLSIQVELRLARLCCLWLRVFDVVCLYDEARTWLW